VIFAILAKKNEKGKYHFKGISIQAVHSTGGGSKIVQIGTALLAAGPAYLSEINPVYQKSTRFSPRITQCDRTIEYGSSRFCFFQVCDKIAMTLELKTFFRLRCHECGLDMRCKDLL